MRHLTENDVQVLRLLKKGIDNKVTKRQLIEKTKLNVRNLYDAIEALRSIGIPIMASRKAGDSGYYIAQTKEEKVVGIAQYKKQIATEQRNLRLLEQADLDSYLYKAIMNPDFWRLYAGELIEVTTTSHSIKVRVKKTL